MSSTLRRASARDWEAIAALLDQHRLPLAGGREHLSDFLVAVDDDRVVGVAGLEMYGDVALLRSVAVAAPGGGVGGRLVQALLDQARNFRAPAPRAPLSCASSCVMKS